MLGMTRIPTAQLYSLVMFSLKVRVRARGLVLDNAPQSAISECKLGRQHAGLAYSIVLRALVSSYLVLKDPIYQNDFTL